MHWDLYDIIAAGHKTIFFDFIFPLTVARQFTSSINEPEYFVFCQNDHRVSTNGPRAVCAAVSQEKMTN